MTNLPSPSAIANIQVTKGATYTLPIVRSSGTAVPDFTTLTWTGGIYTLGDDTLVSAFTVTASSADNLTLTISATITASLSTTVKYGYKVQATTGSTVYIPLKGAIIVNRNNG